MAHLHSLRHPLFRRRWFTDEVIITCVRWYLRFKLSYRDLAELARELGVSVAPSTVLRWVVSLASRLQQPATGGVWPTSPGGHCEQTGAEGGGELERVHRQNR